MVRTRHSLPNQAGLPEHEEEADDPRIAAVLRKLRVDGTDALLGDTQWLEEQKRERERKQYYRWRGAAYEVDDATKDEWIENQPGRWRKRSRKEMEEEQADSGDDKGPADADDDKTGERAKPKPKKRRKKVSIAPPPGGNGAQELDEEALKKEKRRAQTANARAKYLEIRKHLREEEAATAAAGGTSATARGYESDAVDGRRIATKQRAQNQKQWKSVSRKRGRNSLGGSKAAATDIEDFEEGVHDDGDKDDVEAERKNAKRRRKGQGEPARAWTSTTSYFGPSQRDLKKKQKARQKAREERDNLRSMDVAAKDDGDETTQAGVEGRRFRDQYEVDFASDQFPAFRLYHQAAAREQLRRELGMNVAMAVDGAADSPDIEQASEMRGFSTSKDQLQSVAHHTHPVQRSRASPELGSDLPAVALSPDSTSTPVVRAASSSTSLSRGLGTKLRQLARLNAAVVLLDRRLQDSVANIRKEREITRRLRADYSKAATRAAQGLAGLDEEELLERVTGKAGRLAQQELVGVDKEIDEHRNAGVGHGPAQSALDSDLSLSGAVDQQDPRGNRSVSARTDRMQNILPTPSATSETTNTSSEATVAGAPRRDSFSPRPDSRANVVATHTQSRMGHSNPAVYRPDQSANDKRLQGMGFHDAYPQSPPDDFSPDTSAAPGEQDRSYADDDKLPQGEPHDAVGMPMDIDTGSEIASARRASPGLEYHKGAALTSTLNTPRRRTLAKLDNYQRQRGQQPLQQDQNLRSPAVPIANMTSATASAGPRLAPAAGTSRPGERRTSFTTTTTKAKDGSTQRWSLDSLVTLEEDGLLRRPGQRLPRVDLVSSSPSVGDGGSAGSGGANRYVSTPHRATERNRAEHDIFRGRLPNESDSARRRRIKRELRLMEGWERV